MTYNYDRRASESDADYIRGYILGCKATAELFTELADALETPKIKTYADRMLQRAQELREVLPKVVELESLMDSYEMPPTDPAERAKLTQLASDIEKVYSKMWRQDSGDYIAWMLEHYINEVPVAKTIEEIAPGDFEELSAQSWVEEFLSEED